MSFEAALNTHQDLINKIGYNEAYLSLAVGLFIEEPDVDALASAGLTEGGNDKKIDFLYHDRDARRLVFAQGYMAKKPNDSAPANKASDLNTACAWLVSGDVQLVPEKLRDLFVDFRNAIAANEIDFIDLLYIHNLPESINVARELQTVEDHLRKVLDNEKILVKSHELGRTRIEHLFAAQDSHIEVMEDVPFPAEIALSHSGPKWIAGVATVSGEWIHSIYSKYGDKLYSANYRGFLGADGRKRVNSGIRDTIEKNPQDFWAFNNGITILTLKINRAGKSNVSLQGVSIINGAQTSGSIGSVDGGKVRLSDVNVLCRVIESSDQTTIGNIVRYNNTQNAITTWDRFSNDQDQTRISSEFKELGYNYNRKRGFSGTGDTIGIEQVLQPLIAFHGRPSDAVRGKSQLFVQKQLYANAFENKKARHILFVYSLARAIDSKRLELKTKSDANGGLISIEEKQLTLLRNLNFKPFLISVIANSLETIVGYPVDTLTAGFTPAAAKGSTVNELAARWLPIVEAVLPLLTALIDPTGFVRSMASEEDLKVVKLQMDGMLLATQQPGRFKTFVDMVAKS